MNWEKLKAYMQNPEIALENLKRVVPSEDELLIADREMADKAAGGKASPSDIKAMTSARELGMAGAGMAGTLGKTGLSTAEALAATPAKAGGRVIDDAVRAAPNARPATGQQIAEASRNIPVQLGDKTYNSLKEAAKDGLGSAYTAGRQKATNFQREFLREEPIPEKGFTNLQKLINKEKEAEFGTRSEIVSRVKDKVNNTNTDDVIKDLNKTKRELIKSTETPDDATKVIDMNERRGLRGK